MPLAPARRMVLILDSPNGGYVPDVEIERRVLASVADVELRRVTDAREAGELLQRADALIAWHQIPLSREILGELGACRGIVRASVGVDNVDLSAAKALGIPLCNVPEYGTEEVADHALALMLALNRRLPALQGATRRGVWRWQEAAGARRLRGRRLGIVGLGRIGTAVAQRAPAFGMRVEFFDPYVPRGIEKALGVARAPSLEQLLAFSDLVTLHVPLTPETRGMIGRSELALLPPEAILVNTARGPVIDQDALIEALQAGRLAGAGLDVLAAEPDVPAELATRDDVLLTGHSAFYSRESLVELREKAAEAARDFLVGAAARAQAVALGISAGVGA